MAPPVFKTGATRPRRVGWVRFPHAPANTPRPPFAPPTYQSCETSSGVERPCAITQERIRARRVHYEDWIAAILFNHLFAGADAFVAAQLWDLPTQVSAHPDERGVIVAAQVSW